MISDCGQQILDMLEEPLQDVPLGFAPANFVAGLCPCLVIGQEGIALFGGVAFLIVCAIPIAAMLARTASFLLRFRT